MLRDLADEAYTGTYLSLEDKAPYILKASQNVVAGWEESIKMRCETDGLYIFSEKLDIAQ